MSDDPLYDHDLIIATRLLDAGASPNALNKDAPRAHEKSPLYMLAVAETSSVRDRMAMARLLLERGGDPNIGTNEYTWTTLQGLADHARSASHLSEQTVADLASLMVEAGVDATRRDRHGLTAMQIAERKRAPNEFLLNVIEAAEQQTPSP